MTEPKSFADINYKSGAIVFVVCWLGDKDSSFFTWWHGSSLTGEDEFMRDLTDEEPESFFNKGAGNYLIRASWQPEQRSFPEYVDFPGHWEYDVLDFKASEDFEVSA